MDMARILFYDKVCDAARGANNALPFDAEILSIWGRAYLNASVEFPKDAAIIIESILKMEKALQISPGKKDTLCSLGQAYTCLALSTNDLGEKDALHARAAECFEQAASEAEIIKNLPSPANKNLLQNGS